MLLISMPLYIACHFLKWKSVDIVQEALHRNVYGRKLQGYVIFIMKCQRLQNQNSHLWMKQQRVQATQYNIPVEK